MSKQRLAFFFRTKPKEIVSYRLKSLFENRSTRVIPDSFSYLKSEYCIIGSCNGLLCLYDIDQCSAILYNPSISLKSKNSPKLASLDWFMLYNGFGYCQVNNKYEVLIVLQNMASKETLTKIYTFGEDSWRTVQNFTCTPTQLLGKYVNGTLNWVGYKGDVGSTQHVILSFDLEKETYREVLLPQNVGDDYVCRPLLNVLSNCLCMCFVNETHSVVWLMKEYGVVDSWTKLTIIPREKFISDSFMDMLFISENGVIQMKTLSSKLVLYNINSGRLDYPLTSNDQEFDLHIYHESLISPQW
jgi:F-box interacting protein